MASGHRILIVDDDGAAREGVASLVRARGGDVVCASTVDEAIDALSDMPGFDGVVCGQTLGEMDGVAFIREIRRRGTRAGVVVLTSHATVEGAVRMIRAGAVDYLTKPISHSELNAALDRATRGVVEERASVPARSFGRAREAAADEPGVIGSDSRMRRVMELVEAVAPSRTTVLMSGESGTGKSLIANLIHRRSPRRDEAYVELSCGSIPESLLESELFGHVKGAFTGAHADKTGRFRAAHKGTIFLDEINSASPAMQLKLLRVLQERRFEPVGSPTPIDVDARVVLATNQPLEELVESGAFRQDLYYRINVVKIELPALRDRSGDVRTLAQAFLEQQSLELGRTIAGFSPEAIGALERYPFPGNVRELQNVVEHAAVLARGQTIQLEDLPESVVETVETAGIGFAPEAQGVEAGDWIPMPLSDAMRGPERRIILAALAANEWNRQQTAEALGINRTTLYKKMKQLGIDEDEQRRAG